MDSRSVGDATTVVGGPSSVAGGPEFFDHGKHGSSSKKPVPRSAQPTFVQTVDYLEEERPFFVKIGKDGLIAALQKLDRQLKNVRVVQCRHPL